MEMKMESDLFLSLQGKIDMGETLQLPVPLCLAHNYGLQQKTPESSLLKKQEKRVKSEDLSMIGILVIDCILL